MLSNLAEEANPLMNYLLTQGPVLFMLVKLVLVTFGSTLLWRYRHRGLAMVGIIACFSTYYAIFVHHLYAIGHLIMI